MEAAVVAKPDDIAATLAPMHCMAKKLNCGKK